MRNEFQDKGKFKHVLSGSQLGASISRIVGCVMCILSRRISNSPLQLPAVNKVRLLSEIHCSDVHVHKKLQCY